MNERDRALDLLRRIERDSLFASLILIGEGGFVRTVVLGVLRWRSRLDYSIEKLADRRLEKLDPVVVDILRIGIFQLQFMDIAPYAAVSETVDLAARHAKRARGFVNAVLRRAAEGIPEPADIATRLAHPKWLFDRWSRLYGVERATKIAEANQELSYPDALVLDSNAVVPSSAVQSTLVPNIIKLAGSSADLDRAHFYPMDEGSAVIAATAMKAGREVLDVAAAPGGKTLYMRHGGADVISSDVSLARLQPLIGRTPKLIVADGRQPPFRRQIETVLLDAPCSATGTIRKNPELKWRLRESDLPPFARLQKELLTSAHAIAGRYVVYSTCSLEPEENDAVVEGFERVDMAQFVPEGAAQWVDKEGVLRLTPESGADGFTAFALRRSR